MKNKWIWIIAAAVIILLIIGYNQGWFSKTTTSTAAGRVKYDTDRCCFPNNPCGWSGVLYNQQCRGGA